MTSSCKQKKRVLIAGIISMAFFLIYVIIHNINFKTEFRYAPYKDGYKLISYSQAYDDNTKELVIPSEYNGKKVVALSDKVFFKNKKLESVTVPDTVTEFGSSVFKFCKKLKTANLGESLSVMGGECFKGCKSLKSIILPDTLSELRGETFMDCSSLETVVLPAGITEIKGYTFENCTSLKTISIPDGVKRIGAHAFYNCSLLSDVFVPDSVEEIGSSAFRLCKSLKTIKLPQNVFVNERAFKESPTEIQKKEFTDEESEKIMAEINAIDNFEAYVVRKKGEPDDKITYINNMLYISDSADYSKVQPGFDTVLKEGNELMDYLKKAKADNCEGVVFALHSKIASEIKGEPTFVFVNTGIDNAISMVITNE